MTESDQYMYAHEFLLLHLFLSIPVLVATVAIVWFSVRRLRITRALPPVGRLQLLGILLGISAGAILLGIPVWALWPSVIDPMLAGFLSGPTLAASLVLTVVLLTVLHRLWTPRHDPPHESPSVPSQPAS